MSQTCSNSVEVLPHVTDYLLGSTKNTTCRVCKNGRNIAMPKVKQANKTGRNPDFFKCGAEKWRRLTHAEKSCWRDIAKEKDFWSNWTAFMSSFLKSVGQIGLEETMNNDLVYTSSAARLQRKEQRENSIKRNRQYKVDPDYYTRTEQILRDYPVAHDSALAYIRLLDLADVNNALRCKMAYRTDPIVEYEYFPTQTGDIEMGHYIKTSRVRHGDELYELFQLE